MCFSFKSDIDQDELKTTTGAVIAQKSFELFYNDNPEGFSQTVFPNAYSVNMIHTKHGPTLVPMRYRLRPSNSQSEIPAKYNLYNARVESLLEKTTWNSLLGKKHVAVPMSAFNEWVTTDSGKKVVQFSSSSHSTFWVAGLYDIWEDPETKGKLITFAVITTQPTEYILNVGHDRCPIILSNQQALDWIKLNAEPNESFSFLPKSMESIKLTHAFSIL
jgi:putative SOS response-associated peptidase YedK